CLAFQQLVSILLITQSLPTTPEADLYTTWSREPPGSIHDSPYVACGPSPQRSTMWRIRSFVSSAACARPRTFGELLNLALASSPTARARASARTRASLRAGLIGASCPTRYFRRTPERSRTSSQSGITAGTG